MDPNNVKYNSAAFSSYLYLQVNRIILINYTDCGTKSSLFPILQEIVSLNTVLI
jgi:hypothetical protein